MASAVRLSEPFWLLARRLIPKPTKVHCWRGGRPRLLIRWERKATNYEALLHLACRLICWRAVQGGRAAGARG